MSLDGFIAGPNETPDNGLGDGGDRLHEWPFPGAEDGANRQIYNEFMSTGAIVAGSELRTRRRLGRRPSRRCAHLHPQPPPGTRPDRGLARRALWDADQLARLTGVPPIGYVSLFLVVTVGALCAGGWWLLTGELGQ